MSRSKIPRILDPIPAARQEDARHYGVHPYFTRRPANVVREYIKAYSREGDTVLDPFGGTGVTAIEALLLGRKAIHNDLNPFANFIARNIADTRLPTTAPLLQAFERVANECVGPLTEMAADEQAARRWLKKLPLPENIRLPHNSDAEFYYDMFTPRQLAGLALIKRAIDREPNDLLRDLLLLAWSAAIAKLNKTFLSAKGRVASRGGSSIFSIYRYKIAREAVELPIWETFRGRFLNVVAAKEEIIQVRNYWQLRPKGRVIDSSKDFRVLAMDAAALDAVVPAGSVDYIFTDPPYGAFISYLDLSILWDHWLGFPITDEARKSETIVGGELSLSEDHYKDSLARSLRTCFRLLRPDRWMSVVFQHWDVSYFSTILETADDCGAELKSAITQTGDVIWSMHKKKNSASVIAGEMIITFYKPARVRSAARKPAGAMLRDPGQLLSEVFQLCLNNGESSFTNEALFNRLIMELWSRNALRCLQLDRREFVDRLRAAGWHYNASTHRWSRSGEPEGSQAVTLFER